MFLRGPEGRFPRLVESFDRADGFAVRIGITVDGKPTILLETPERVIVAIAPVAGRAFGGVRIEIALAMQQRLQPENIGAAIRLVATDAAMQDERIVADNARQGRALHPVGPRGIQPGSGQPGSGKRGSRSTWRP